MIVSIPQCVESDGIGAALMPVVCAWCRVPLGAKVCAPAMSGKVSHGMCEACSERLMRGMRPIAGDGRTAR